MKILSQIVLEIKENKTTIFIVLLLTAIGKALAISVPFLLKTLIDALIYDMNWSTGFDVSPSVLVLAYATVFFLSGFIDELREYISEKSIQPIIGKVFSKIYSHILHLPISYYLDSQTGSTLRDLDRGSRAMQSLTSIVLYTFLPLFIELIIVIGILLISYSSKYGMVVLLGVASHILVTTFLTENLTHSRRQLNQHDTEIGGHIGESIDNFEIIKTLSTASYEENKLANLYKSYLEKVVDFQYLHSRLKVIQKLIISVTIGFILLVGSHDVMTATITPGDFILLNAFAMQLFLPISSMGILWKEFRQNLADVSKLSSVYELPIDLPANNKVRLLESPPSIKFENVSYTYPNGKEALKNITFEVPAGSFIAVVGNNGSGKSTFLKILLGLIQPSGGSIYIDDKPIEFGEFAEFRKYIGSVPQNVKLFHGSIKENLVYGAPNLDDVSLINLAKKVGIHDEILSKFHDGYQTQVGQHGLKLSGGERQKIGLARALARNPKLLILDEPAASLDRESETKTLSAKGEILNGRTTFMVTHKVSVLKHADVILHLRNGRLIEIESSKKSTLNESDNLFS